MGQKLLELHRGLLVECGRYVAVSVESDRDGAVTEQVLDELGVDAGLQESRRRRVAEIVVAALA